MRQIGLANPIPNSRGGNGWFHRFAAATVLPGRHAFSARFWTPDWRESV